MKYKSEDLWDDLLTEHSITCSKCNDTDNAFNIDDQVAVEYFFKQGWRRTPHNLYCPECAKKHLKQR